ncbi:MAG: hypothetical protein ACRC23_01515 [Aeromonas jandaei]
MKLRKIEILTFEEGGVFEVLEKIIARTKSEDHKDNTSIVHPKLHNMAKELYARGVAGREESLITTSSIYELTCRKNAKSFIREVWSHENEGCENCAFLKADKSYCFCHDFEVYPHTIACDSKKLEGYDK